MFTVKRVAGVALLAAVGILAGCCASEQEPLASDPPRDVSATPPERDSVLCGRVPFVEGYARGYREAQQQGKPMLVFFTAEWCNFCHQMADETFADADVVKWSSRFVCILVDADAEPDVCHQFRVEGYPTIQFLSPQGVPLNRVVGRRPADQLLPQMQAALGATASRTTPTALR